MIGSICKQGGTELVLFPLLILLVLLQTSGVTCTRGYQQQFLKLSSTYLKAELGDDVELECKLEPRVLDEYPDIKLSWMFSYMDSMEVIYSTPWNKSIPGYSENGLDGTRIKLTRNLYTLYLDRIQQEQEGTYICRVSNEELEVSEEVFVDVRKPKKVDSGEVITYDVDQNVKLLCVDMEARSRGEVSGNVIWRKNGKIVTDNPELKLFRVDKDDEGEYHCMVKGSLKRNVTVKIDRSPKVYTRSKQILQHPGYGAKLACSVHSSQVPIISWYKEERISNGNETSTQLNEITNKTFSTEFTERGITSILEFDSVSSSSYGLYTCNASTQLGNDSKEIRLMYSATPVFEKTSLGYKQTPNIIIIPTIILLLSNYLQ